jgi:hypothetical protein
VWGGGASSSPFFFACWAIGSAESCLIAAAKASTARLRDRRPFCKAARALKVSGPDFDLRPVQRLILRERSKRSTIWGTSCMRGTSLGGS